jgi:hypothetical protein
LLFAENLTVSFSGFSKNDKKDGSMKKPARKRKHKQRNVGSHRTRPPQCAVVVPPTVRRYLSAMRKSLISALFGANWRCLVGQKKETFMWQPNRAHRSDCKSMVLAII